MFEEGDDAGRIRLAIAEQVIKSTGDILVAAGFRRDEIGSFFRQAADQLASQVPGAGNNISQEDLSGAKRADALEADFRASAPVRKLSALSQQVESLGSPNGSPSSLESRLDLAMQMIPHIAEAQDWLRGAADESGLRILSNRHEFQKDPAGKQMESTDQILFLEDFEVAYARNFELIGSLIDALVQRGDEETFSFLLESLFENGVVISFGLKRTMERGVEALAKRQM